jgi:hypothetical protein
MRGYLAGQRGERRSIVLEDASMRVLFILCKAISVAILSADSRQLFVSPSSFRLLLQL